jgi:4-amino-4-deoxy-L-arabinose transferase-like glycosyltransferase
MHESDPTENAGRAWWRERPWRTLALAAAGLRALFGLALALGDPLLGSLLSDAAYYDDWARALAADEPFRAGLPHWLPPLYPWILGWLYGLSGGALGVTIALQAAIGVALTLAVGRLTARVTDERTGLVAGWLWTLYLPVSFFETRLLGVNAALPLCLLCLHAGLTVAERLESGRRALGPAALAGLAAGIASLARPNLLLCLPGAGLGLLWLARRAPRAATVPTLLVAGLGLAAGVAPGWISNHQRSGQSVLVSANGGVNFWFGNNPQAHGTFHAPGPEWGAIDEQRDVSLALATEAEGRALDEGQASRWWAARGRSWLAANPIAALRLWGLKLADTLSSFEFGIQYVPSAIRAQVPLLWAAPLPFGLLLGLCVLGAGKVRRAAPLIGWILAGVAAGLLYFTYSRFRLPWLPALLPFSAAGALVCWDALRARRLPQAAPLAAALLLLAQSFVPFEGDYPELLERHAREDAARAWVELGRGSRVAGDERRAERRFARATELDPRSAGAHYELCSLLLSSNDPRRRDPARALELLERWRADAALVGAADPESRMALGVLHAAALLETAPMDPEARARAAALVDQVLAEDPQHPGASELARVLDRR